MTKALYSYNYNKTYKLHINDRCLFSRLRFIYDNRLIDRFDYLNQFSKWNFCKHNHQLPEYRPELDYTQLCMNRAIEIINAYPEGVAVAYSGGVDSTGVICILLLAGLDPKKIRVLCNADSIDENPEFFLFLNRIGCNIAFARPDQVMEHFDNIPERVIIFGGVNDQLYHVGTVYKDTDLQKMPINDAVKARYTELDNQKYLENDLEILHNYSSLIGWDINDLFDLSVLLNYGCRYIYVQEHVKLQCFNSLTRDKIIQFFDNKDFSDWAFTFRKENKEQWQKTLQDPSWYKRHVKNIIYSVFPNDEYFKHKVKEGSWLKHWKSNYVQQPYAYVGVHDKSGYHVSLFDRLLSSVKETETVLYPMQKLVLDQYVKDEFK